MKRHSTCVIGRLQLKTDDPTHLLKWIKSKTLITPNASEDAEQQDTHSLLVGMCHGTTTLQESSAVSYKTKHSPAIWSNNCVLRYLDSWIETFIHTNTCTWMFITVFFIVTQNWKQPRYSTTNETDCSAFTNGILLINKKKWSIKLWRDI